MHCNWFATRCKYASSRGETLLHIIWRGSGDCSKVNVYSSGGLLWFDSLSWGGNTITRGKGFGAGWSFSEWYRLPFGDAYAQKLVCLETRVTKLYHGSSYEELLAPWDHVSPSYLTDIHPYLVNAQIFLRNRKVKARQDERGQMKSDWYFFP